MERPAIVTPTALERVAKKVEQGVRAAEIANEIGLFSGDATRAVFAIENQPSTCSLHEGRRGQS